MYDIRLVTNRRDLCKSWDFIPVKGELLEVQAKIPTVLDTGITTTVTLMLKVKKVQYVEQQNAHFVWCKEVC